MRIMVLMKEVLDSECPFALTEEAATLDECYLPTVVDPSDLSALAKTRASFPQGTAELVAVSVDASSSVEAVRSAIAYGADRAVVVKGTSQEQLADSGVRAKIIARLVSKLEADLVVSGATDVYHTLDASAASLAVDLGWPFVANASFWKPAREGKSLEIKRKLDHGDREVLACNLPLVLASDGAHDSLPYPSFPFLLKARMAKIEEYGLEDLGLKPVDVRSSGAMKAENFIPPRPRTKRTSEGKKTGSALMASMMGGGAKKKSGGLVEGAPEEVASRIVAFLNEKGLLEDTEQKV